MRRARVVSAVVGFVLATSTALSSATGGGLITAAPADRTFRSIDAALGHDLALVADGQGWTIAQATAYHRAAEIIGRVAEQVNANTPEVFVGSALSEEPGGAPTLFIKGPADRFIRDLVSSAAIPIRVADGQPFSFEELEVRKLRVHNSLETLGFRYASTGFDITDGGRIHAGVTRQAGLPDDAGVLVLALPEELRGSVTITVSDLPIVADREAFGGMWVRDDGVNECTSGWSVINGAGTTGVTTAGHCSGINQVNHPGHGIHALTLRAEHRGQWGDVEWHTSTQLEPPKFIADENGDIRNVTAVENIANIAVGEFVCLFGRGSFSRNCNLRVQDVSQACTNNGVFNDRLVMMNGTVGQPGDSGGGWSFNNTAYGSDKGLCFPDFPENDVFSAAHWYPNALGVNVRIQ